MDFESGTSLSEMLKEGRTFDEKQPAGDHPAHRRRAGSRPSAGVLHRDIKPANILVNGTGRPVLIDFGSARFDAGQATNTKVTFYTPPYAAIEQYVKSFPQGPWTDIYALGVVLYQCVSGEKPPEVLERLHGEDGPGAVGQRVARLQPQLHAGGGCGDGDPAAGASAIDLRLAQAVRWQGACSV